VELLVFSDTSEAFSTGADEAVGLNENALVVEPNAELAADPVPNGEAVVAMLFLVVEVVLLVSSDFSLAAADCKGDAVGLKPKGLLAVALPKPPNPVVLGFAEISAGCSVGLLNENGDVPACAPCLEKSKAGLAVTTAAVVSVGSVEDAGVPKLKDEVVAAGLVTDVKENGFGMLEAVGLIENGESDVVVTSLVWLAGLKPNAGAEVVATSLVWLAGLKLNACAGIGVAV
jgi:hypothetical protein